MYVGQISSLKQPKTLTKNIIYETNYCSNWPKNAAQNIKEISYIIHKTNYCINLPKKAQNV